MALLMQGEQLLDAPIEVVWAALNEPDVLKKSIPGCESLELTSDNEMVATVVLKVGPIKATFKGQVTLQDLQPPNSYTIVGEGKGGIAGAAKGAASVSLEPVSPNETLLRYDVKVDVSGKIAQLGARLLNSTAKKLTQQFFDDFAEQTKPLCVG